MKKTIGLPVKKLAWLLTLVYFGSYLLRINIAVMLVKIGSDLGVTKTLLAAVLTGQTICYGLGQVINGILGDKIKPQYMIAGGLSLAILANISIYFCKTVPVMTAVWCINGFAHSMLWPPIVRIMSMTFNDEEYGYASVRVSWGSSFATVFLYTLCPFLLQFTGWRNVMLFCAFGGILILTVWFLLSPKLLVSEKTGNRKEAEKKEKELLSKEELEKQGEKGEKALRTKEKTSPLPKYVYFPIVFIMLGIALQGSLRDGVTDWMPSFLLETFHIPEEKAIFATVILALFSIVSFYFFDLLHRKLLKNEVFCAAVTFLVSLVSALLLYFSQKTGSMVFVSMLLMAVIVACMHGINLMLITVVPKRFVKSGKVSTFSGLFNAFTYVGSSIAAYGFAALAERHGWGFTTLSWAVISLLGFVVCFVVTPLWNKFKKEYAE